MNRVSTSGNYSAVLANLMAAQQRQADANAQVSSQKVGHDLKGFAKHAEMLTAIRSVQVRGAAYLEQNQLVADKLSTQDAALNQIADAAQAARQAIADALASGRGDTLVEDIQAQMRNVVDGLNARYGGKYLFAGGQVDSAPMTATSLSDLTALGTVIADFFKNDDFLAQNKVDDATTVTTGVLADDIGTDVMTSFKSFQSFQEGVNGPFTGVLTPAQKTFLEGELTQWDTSHRALINIAGRNGLLQRRVEGVNVDLDGRQATLQTMMGGITDVDMAQAISNLQAAQLSVQASAQALVSMQQSSLLNFLN